MVGHLRGSARRRARGADGGRSPSARRSAGSTGPAARRRAPGRTRAARTGTSPGRRRPRAPARPPPGGTASPSCRARPGTPRTAAACASSRSLMQPHPNNARRGRRVRWLEAEDAGHLRRGRRRRGPPAVLGSSCSGSQPPSLASPVYCTATIPSALAPATSVRSLSPTCAASAGGNAEALEGGRNASAAGLNQPGLVAEGPCVEEVQQARSHRDARAAWGSR